MSRRDAVEREVRDHGYAVLRDLARASEHLGLLTALLSHETDTASEQFAETAEKYRPVLGTMRDELWRVFSKMRQHHRAAKRDA